MLDLFDGEVGILQCRGCKGDKPIRLRGAELDQGLVLDSDQCGDDIALGPVPVWIDAERLDIDARVIHLRQTVADIGPQETRRFERVIDQLRRIAQGLQMAVWNAGRLKPSPRRIKSAILVFPIPFGAVPCALAQQRPAAGGPRCARRPHRLTQQWRGE